MSKKLFWICTSAMILLLLAACQGNATPSPTSTTLAPTLVPPTQPATLAPTAVPVQLSITLGTTNSGQGLSLDEGGDVDTRVVQVGNPAAEARQSGNGAALPSPDGNTTGDSFFQFKIDDGAIFKGSPTGHVRVEVDYLDQGTDTFSIEYDAQPTSGSTGKFYGGGAVVKTNSGGIKTAAFNLCNAYFANRDNGADFRISDNSDGAETILAVRVIGLPSGVATVHVDDFGANPVDDQPDSEAIQSALDSTCSGDTIVFTSGASTSGYQGYLIDKTLFLTGMSAKQNLTFTSSNPNDHALLRATADLKGYVVRLYARSRFNNSGDIDNIDFGYIDVDGGRDVRKCLGSDNLINGIDDNWGSWLPECSQAGDPWCSPGNIGMDGAMDTGDVNQDYASHPSQWTTGVVVHDLTDRQAECGSALAFGGAAGTIRNVTIDTAGDHVHVTGCALTDNDGDVTGWSDGITLFGPAHQIVDNTIINPTDVGIAFFGGRDTVIANNTFRIDPGNHGAFAAIAVHSWSFGDASGIQIVGNTITSEGDTRCGGLHVGINLGPHMWGGACVPTSTGAIFGNPACSTEPSQSLVAPCTGGPCQIWSLLPAGGTFTLKDNTVTGANINYLVEGFDILGQFVDENNISQTPRVSDWQAARTGCNGVTWGALDKVAHHPSLPGWTDMAIHCER
jgi:hypothetical protein